MEREIPSMTDSAGFLLKFGSWEHAQGQGLVEKELRGSWLKFGQGENLCQLSPPTIKSPKLSEPVLLPHCLLTRHCWWATRRLPFSLAKPASTLSACFESSCFIVLRGLWASWQQGSCFLICFTWNTRVASQETFLNSNDFVPVSCQDNEPGGVNKHQFCSAPARPPHCPTSLVGSLNLFLF